MSEKREFFSSRWGLLAASLGCAIGVGNIWRFPRIAAENGGGAFLVPWILFLFIWSIPLIIAEYSLGRKTREGVVGTFATFGKSNKAWMGAFIALVASAVLFYYAVIVGWCVYYFLLSLKGTFTSNGLTPGEAKQLFLSFAGTPVTIFYQAIPLLICGGIIYNGGVKGIERLNEVLIPALFVLLVIAAIRACTLPGAGEGIRYLFVPRWEYLTSYKTWIEALAQSAWSTGAGFGLFLTYAVYVGKKQDIVANSLFTAVGNNIASIIAALAVIPTVFAILPTKEANEALSAGSVGLTFFWLPELFAKMPLGWLFSTLFFITLVFAGLSSLISLVELPTRVIMDFGVPRKKAVTVVVAVSFALGIPSALSLNFLDNQDYVWGKGLILSGLMFAVLIIRYGAPAFRKHLLDKEEDMEVGSWFDYAIVYLVPLQVLLMMGWWFYRAVKDLPDWWNPVAAQSIGTSVMQWGLAIGLFAALNRFLKEKVVPTAQNSDTDG